MNDYLTIIFLLSLMGVCIMGMKYINGDFSPISIDVVDKQEVVSTNVNGEVISKKMVIISKYTYKDGRIKHKTKKIKI